MDQIALMSVRQDWVYHGMALSSFLSYMSQRQNTGTVRSFQLNSPYYLICALLIVSGIFLSVLSLIDLQAIDQKSLFLSQFLEYVWYLPKFFFVNTIAYIFFIRTQPNFGHSPLIDFYTFDVFQFDLALKTTELFCD